MPRYIVPDTCAIAAGLFTEAHTARAVPLVDAIRHNTVDAIAPEVGLAEFLNICRKKLDPRFTNPVLSVADVEAALGIFRSLGIVWIAMHPLVENAWRLHRDHGVETSDAYFLETARQWGAELWTIDQPFFTAAGSVYGQVFDLRSAAFS